MRALTRWLQLGFCAAAFAVPSVASGETPALYIRGKRIILRPGEEIQDGAILVRDGRIIAVGRDLRKPDDAKEIEGAVVCAAYIDAWGAIGLGMDSLRDASTSAATRTADGLDPWSDEHLRLETLRAGVTVVRVQAGADSRVGGIGVLVRVAPDLPPGEAIVLADAIRETDEYLFTHMASTGVLAILLGHRLGIGKVKLSDLGLAAMLHGLGRFRSGPELVQREKLSPEEKVELGKHPYRALGAILEGHKVTSKMLVAATTAFQFDLHTGHTVVRIPPEEVHPFCQVIRVCDVYTRYTSELTDRPPLLPDQAIKRMVEAKPGTFDPLVLTVFVNMMGLYPTGTVVTLDTGEVAVVVHPNPEHPKRPLVAVVRSPSGDDVDGDMLDLADAEVRARISGSVDPAELGLNIPEYLLS